MLSQELCNALEQDARNEAVIDMVVVAIVGASESSLWPNCARKNLLHYGRSSEEVLPVNPKHETVWGQQCWPNLRSLPITPAIAIVSVPAGRCADVVRDAAVAGVKSVVVIASGFSEGRVPSVGGAERQQELVSIAADAGISLYGPNCVGYSDFAAGICAIAEPIPLDIETGPVSFISQSGALVSAALAAFASDRVGLDFCVSIGNGAMVGVASLLNTLVERPTTELICAYLEGWGPGEFGEFIEAAALARAHGKLVVVVKSGRSQVAKELALSHTASLAGEDSLVDATFRSVGVLRVDSVAELARVAQIALLIGRDRWGELDDLGVVFLGQGGGSAGMAADLASVNRVRLASLSLSTTTEIQSLVGSASFIQNPFDLVGVSPDVMKAVGDSVYSDPTVGLVVTPCSTMFPDASPEMKTHRAFFRTAELLADEHSVPTVMNSIVHYPVTDWVARNLTAPYFAMSQGLALTFKALGCLFPEATVRKGDDLAEDLGGRSNGAVSVLDEAESREILDSQGIPVVPGILWDPRIRRAESALEDLRPPYALKAMIAGLTHKGKVGGVVLGLLTSPEVEAAARDMTRRLESRRLDCRRFLIEEMHFGPEVLLSSRRSGELGIFVTVGVGGTLSEVASRVCTLPSRALDDIEASVSALGIDACLRPGRLGELGTLARYLVRYVEEEKSVLEVEINPLIDSPSGWLAADAVVIREKRAGRIVHR